MCVLFTVVTNVTFLVVCGGIGNDFGLGCGEGEWWWTTHIFDHSSDTAQTDAMRIILLNARVSVCVSLSVVQCTRFARVAASG